VFNGVLVSGGMETAVNGTMEIGALTETVTVSAETATVRSSAINGLPQSASNITMDGVSRNALSSTYSLTGVPADAIEEVMLQSAQQADANGAQLGDLFEYKLKQPVTIRKNQSALVPILSGEVEAEKVSLWNPTVGSSRPLRAIWLTNATGLTLDGGSFSVVEGQAFAGEGLMEPLKAGAKRLLSYAVDLGVYVDAKLDGAPTQVTKVRISRGLMVQTTEERQRYTYTVRNDDTEARSIVIEHPFRADWKTTATVTAAETTAAWQRFRVPVAAKTTVTFTVDDVRPGLTQYAVSSITDDQIKVLVRDELIAPDVEQALMRIQAQKAEVIRLATAMQAKSGEIATIGHDQERVRENMKSLRGSAEEKQLLQRYVKQLQDQEDRLEAMRKELQTLTDERAKAQAELTRMIEELAG
jgi:hypothetical protein